MKITRSYWTKALLERKAYPYIKPNRHIHDSGWRCFEVGYLVLDNNSRVKNKLVLSEYTDHVQPIDFSDITNGKASMVNIDLTRDGYIRFHYHEPIWWGGMEYAYSSAILSLLKSTSLD